MLINSNIYSYKLLFKSENWNFIKITKKSNFSFIVGSIYFQLYCDIEEKLSILESQLLSLPEFRNDNTVFIIGGDFNGRVGNLNQLPPGFLALIPFILTDTLQMI